MLPRMKGATQSHPSYIHFFSLSHRPLPAGLLTLLLSNIGIERKFLATRGGSSTGSRLVCGQRSDQSKIVECQTTLSSKLTSKGNSSSMATIFLGSTVFLGSNVVREVVVVHERWE